MRKKHFVYVLRSLKDKDLYIGVTDNLIVRLGEHNSGKNYSTRSRKPFQLVFCEVFYSKEDAYSREKYLKTGWGRKHLRNALKYTLRA